METINWKFAFQEAMDALSDIPHPMAEEAWESLNAEYGETEEE